MMRRLPLLTVLLATAMPASAAAPRASGTPHAVTFDRHSVMIDGRPTVLWGGEFHPFRLPSPDLWRDILQKMKASGYNTVAIYFDWGYHSPKRGVYDFTGVRDMDRVLRMAAEEGLYVITRAGPYVNAELTRGGFPGWLVNQSAKARTDDPEYLAAADEWLTRINAIIARHQLTDGRGTVILHQIENELAVVQPTQARYMQHLYDKARADGITVPIFHNDQGRNGYWVPKGANVPKTVEGPVDLYAFDGYPGATCDVHNRPTNGPPAPDWGLYGTGGARGGASASPNTPGFAAEFGGGWFDYWGSNGGYDCNAVQRGKRYQRVFYGTNIANGITVQSFYMTYGGTSWGWLPAPVVYTSYDYGAAIDEARGLRPKALELKQLGQFLAAAPDIARMDRAPPATASDPDIQVYHNVNAATGARLLFVTHKPSNGRSDDRFTITAALKDGPTTFPAGAPMRLNGFDGKLLLADFRLERQELVYSTSELQTHLPLGDTDLALFYGRAGEPGETVLRYATQPTVTGPVEQVYDAAKGRLRLNYTHAGIARVQITGGGRPPLTLLLADEDSAARFFRTESAAGPVLSHGPDLVRSATATGGTLALTGDVAVAAPLEIWGPPAVRTLRWNGRALPVTRGPGDSLVTAALPGPAVIALPPLTDWRQAPESPEAQLGFDDSRWADAKGARQTATIRPPVGQPNLGMDAYGFHEGDVWYRGRFAGGTDARKLTLHYGAGGAGMLQVWLDGTFVGQHELAGGLPRPITTGVADFVLPVRAQAAGEHLLSVMVRNNSHNWDLDTDDFHKETRGLISASLAAPTSHSFAVPIAWKIQGTQGGEDIVDPVRGVANNGGLFGEREGWHLPGFADGGWAKTPAPAGTPSTAATPGTTWYRTAFDLGIPTDQDATIGIAIGNTAKPRSDGTYRVLIFVNGWNMGQFVANVGPQRIFPVPAGILNHRGRNTLALAVTGDGKAGSALEPVKLVTIRNVRGGIPVAAVPFPSWRARAR
ncbi:glycoside hydrolase family 35 protein [Sphingomonas montana]|uniref:glycoside hydrolase family 35 protein n=1 Tax=Sphingomonas montana TaxID=1843236 RepID=UPI001F0ACBBC|nr:beta-galactosidase [Sphingomonas montana]